MGIKMPNMGMNEKSRIAKVRKGTSLADALFSTVQQRVLAYQFGQPGRSFFATELIKLAGGGSDFGHRDQAAVVQPCQFALHRAGDRKSVV